MGRSIDARCDHAYCEGKGEYIVPGACGNCGWRGRVRITKGHTTGRYECPKCGCYEVRA